MTFAEFKLVPLILGALIACHSPTDMATKPQFGSTFGAPQLNTFGGFGATQAPAFGAGTAFGSTAPPAFGSTAPPAFGAAPNNSFGAPAPAFGANPAPAFGSAAPPAFGANPTPGFGNNPPPFGANAAPAFGSTNPPAFGSTNTPTFGSTSAPAFGSVATPGFGAGNPPAFGSTSAPAFGSNTTPAFGVAASIPSTGLNFGAPASSAPGFGGTAAPLFGAPGVSAPPPSFNFGAPGISAPAPTLPGFSFGGAATTSAPAFGLGTNPSLFNKPVSTLPSLAKPQTSLSLGLGGLTATSSAQIGGIGSGIAGGIGSNQSAPLPKTNALPAELATTVDAFKENVRQRKQLSSDIARFSIRPLHKVQSDADSLMRESNELIAAVTARRRTASNLRTCGANALPAAERAHRIAETPHGIEYESSDVISWITDVVADGETRLKLLHRQLEAAQHQIDASPKPITDEDLSLGMRRIHESFIAVAGRLQTVHQQVEGQKAQYLTVRRNILKDNTDIFVKKNGSSKLADSARIEWLTRNTSKPSNQQMSSVVADPFMALGLSQSNRQQSTTGPNPFTNLSSSNFGFGFSKNQSTTGLNTSSLSNTNWGMTSLQHGAAFPALGSSFGSGLTNPVGVDSAFALQKPPAGNKRGKY